MICMKAEYDLSKMNRKGHPLRKKVLQGELKLINPLDIINRENNLARFVPNERERAQSMEKTSSNMMY